MWRKIYFLIVAFFWISKVGWSQPTLSSTSWNTWLIVNTLADLNDKWSTGFEFHERTAEPFATRSTLIMRPYLSRSLHPNIAVALGYSWVRSFPYSPFGPSVESIEHNAWEQFSAHLKRKYWLLETRIRMENRWIKPENAALFFVNRLRVRLLFRQAIPLRKGFEVFGQLSDELFFQQNKYFVPEQLNTNWLTGGIGWGYKKKTEMVFSIQQQLDRLGNENYISRPIFWLSVLSHFNFIQKNPDPTPVHKDSF